MGPGLFASAGAAAPLGAALLSGGPAYDPFRSPVLGLRCARAAE